MHEFEEDLCLFTAFGDTDFYYGCELEEKKKAKKEKERKDEKTTQEAEESSKAEQQTWVEGKARARELRRIAKQKKFDRAVAEAVDKIMGEAREMVLGPKEPKGNEVLVPPPPVFDCHILTLPSAAKASVS